MTWFETLTGFRESSPQQVREHITLDGETLISHVNGRVMVCGRLETPSLGDLRTRVQAEGRADGKLSLREVVADVQALHADESNAGAFFQVASQFNLLEMTSPHVTPEEGIGLYEYDHTQGPACAIAAGAGTLYRNYFAPVNGRIGQFADNQIDCLADLGAAPGKIEAAYEATILVGILNARATGNKRCYLTLLGGGAFGNAGAWILDAIRRALAGYAWAGLDVAIVSYGRSSGAVRGLVGEI